MRFPLVLLPLVLLTALASAETATHVKTEHFDRDPGWEGVRNHLTPKQGLEVTQDFGYSPGTNHAGKAKGEIGGRVQRSTTPAFYAERMAPKTLNDKLSASGSVAFTETSGNAGLFFGFFNAAQPGGSGRPIQSLGMDFDGEPSGARLAVRMINSVNKSCGSFVTPFVPGKFRPTPIRKDGTRYFWTLTYDPEGNGRFTYTFRSDREHEDFWKSELPEPYKAEARKRFPATTTFTVDLPPGFKQEGATFDRFGMMNLMKSGKTMGVYFDDVTLDGKAEDFARDPGWQGSGNRTSFEDREVVGAHDFGYSAKTNYAGGSAGEIGGGFWRTEKDWGYYADRVGGLTLNQRLEASGRMVLRVGGPDSDMNFGWFSPAEGTRAPATSGPFVGIHVGGPTRVGHYFLPVFTAPDGTRMMPKSGPILKPGKAYEWSLVYDPEASGGLGSLTAALGDEKVTLDLKQGVRSAGKLDCFGMVSANPGGQLVKVYLDDLRYTTAR